MTRYLVNGTGANAARRPVSSPAPTVHFGSRLNTVTWIEIEETMTNDDERTTATRAAIAHYGRWPEGEGAFVAGWMAHAAQGADKSLRADAVQQADEYLASHRKSEVWRLIDRLRDELVRAS